ncbi:MAG TPA: hypothetical protein VF061_01915, partial [Gemmatimonadales bacterium]
MARNVIVATFDTRNQAYDAASDIDRVSGSIIDVMSGAIVEKDLLGNVTTLDTKNIGGAWGTVGGVAGGALVGALVGLLGGPGGAAIGTAVGAAAASSGAAAGSLVGGTLGWSGDLINWGLNEDYLDTVRTRIMPGTVAVVA